VCRGLPGHELAGLRREARQLGGGLFQSCSKLVGSSLVMSAKGTTRSQPRSGSGERFRYPRSKGFPLSHRLKATTQAHSTERHRQGRFSRRLQLAPGLVPPPSWSLSPCTGPEIHWRARLIESPDSGAIYLTLMRSAVNLRVTVLSRTGSAAAHGVALFLQNRKHILIRRSTTTPKQIVAKSLRRSKWS
jgi:hypothetical protein